MNEEFAFLFSRVRNEFGFLPPEVQLAILDKVQEHPANWLQILSLLEKLKTAHEERLPFQERVEAYEVDINILQAQLGHTRQALHRRNATWEAASANLHAFLFPDEPRGPELVEEDEFLSSEEVVLEEGAAKGQPAD